MNEIPMSPLHLFIKSYGAMAFGTAILLIVWLTIIQPELKNRSLNFDAMAQLIQQQEQLVIAMDAVADTQKESATILDRITIRLERISERE